MQHLAPRLSALFAGAALLTGSLLGLSQATVVGAQPTYPPGPTVAAFPQDSFELNPQPEPPGATYPPGPTIDGGIIQD